MATPVLHTPASRPPSAAPAADGPILSLSQSASVVPPTLTGLPGRSVFQAALAQSIARNYSHGLASAVLFADIDHFRVINSGYGHELGDEFLRQVATRIKQSLDADAQVYHFSGDLFAILLRDLTTDRALRTQVCAVAERIQQGMVAPFVVGALRMTLSCSIGIAVATIDGRDPPSLISAADTAMHLAKAQERGSIQFARNDLAQRARRRLALAEDIRRGVEAREFVPFYEPVVDLQAGCLLSAECLVRWNHPKMGLVFPGDFIGIAVETSQVDGITDLLLDQACAQLAKWRAGGQDLRLSFNLSPRQLQPGLVERVRDTAVRHQIDCRHIEAELTEGAMIERPEQAERLLHQLRALGMSLSLDDFGTGFSSLSHLHRFPLDKLKIDRSFTSRLETDRRAEQIVSAIIGLAANLNLQVVAEGVETAAQMRHLATMGCHLQQGYFFSRALPVGEFETWMNEAPGRIQELRTHAQL